MATAYAALLSVLNDLEAIKNNPYHFFSFENKQIQSLSESVIFLIDFMESCDNYHGASKEAARVLERAIARAAQAAEDVIESHVVDQILAGSTKLGKRIPRFLMDLQKVIDNMEFVKRKAMKVDGQARSGHITELQSTNLPAATSSTTSDSNAVVGFDDVLLQLLDQLTGEASNHRQTIPITGMGGIGKTTLAKTAFQHPLIVNHFDVCRWATISQQYVVGDILSKLLSGYEIPNSGSVDHELGEQLHKSLYGRRYLIVLDDMWRTDVWDDIQNFFPDSSNGSRIVVTTRQTEVAAYLGSPCFPLRLLDEDRSWDLLCQKAFAGQGCPVEVEDAGKKIVNKCKGLPLAITVVGAHLAKSPRTQQHWENVADDMMNTVFDSGDENEELQVFDILSLSYSYLPVHLKPCFLYMGTFPEDHIIVMKMQIIKPWIGEGFIKPNQTGESLEIIAQGYLEDLIERNLVLLNDDMRGLTHPGKSDTCRMHDVIRELCLKIAKKEQFLDFLDAPRAVHMEERRVVISEKIPKDHEFDIFTAQRSAPLIRSLTWYTGPLWFDLKLVRVLNAGGRSRANKIRNKGKFPSANLRYLKCSSDNAHGNRLLHQMSHFWNLQTLILLTPTVTILPYEIWDMVHLRHLEGFILLPDPLYRDKSHQVNLQTLKIVYNFRLIEEVCNKIPCVKDLWLVYDKLGENLEIATSHFNPQNLASFRELELLYIFFGDDSICRHGFALSFTFPRSLKKLKLYKTRLGWEELTEMVGSLPLLEFLSLESDAVTGSEWTPVEGTFLRLTHLTINLCHDLVYLNVSDSDFPRLRHLCLVPSPEMNELPLEIGDLPSLELLTLEGTNLSLALSVLGILDNQDAQGNDCLQLRVSLNKDDDAIRFMKEVGKDGLKRKNLFVGNYLSHSERIFYLDFLPFM